MRKQKRYNPHKNLQTTARAILKNTAIGFVTGTSACQLIDLKQKKFIPVTSNKFTLVSQLRHPWSVFIAGIGLDDQNNYYMKANEVSVTTPSFQSDMVDSLNNEHKALLANFNRKHLISAGWLATPYAMQWSESKAFELLELLGALEFTQSNITHD